MGRLNTPYWIAGIDRHVACPGPALTTCRAISVDGGLPISWASTAPPRPKTCASAPRLRPRGRRIQERTQHVPQCGRLRRRRSDAALHGRHFRDRQAGRDFRDAPCGDVRHGTHRDARRLLARRGHQLRPSLQAQGSSLVAGSPASTAPGELARPTDENGRLRLSAPDDPDVPERPIGRAEATGADLPTAGTRDRDIPPTARACRSG